jgi:O-antigen/teichoic acid export membrane protein
LFIRNIDKTKMGGSILKTINFIRVSLVLLVATIPLSLIGYLFAVNYEDLFYMYEWALIFLIVAAAGMALTGALQAKDQSRWVLVSILAFCIHIAVLALFLAPFSIYSMFWVYYVMTVLAFFVYFHTYLKVKFNRSVTVLLMFATFLMTLFIVFLHMLWGVNLT